MKTEAAIERPLDEFVSTLRLLEADSSPDGYPAVKMRDITVLLDVISEYQFIADWLIDEHMLRTPDGLPCNCRACAKARDVLFKC